MPHGGLCPWPTFHSWVTMVRKKWLSLYYSTYWCYIHQTCTNCSSWHDLLMSLDGLCPWPTSHAWVTNAQNGNCRAPVMVPITIMSSFNLDLEVWTTFWKLWPWMLVSDCCRPASAVVFWQLLLCYVLSFTVYIAGCSRDDRCHR